MSKVDKIIIQKWINRGGMLLNTEALDYDDPDHPYNQALAQGACPEDFGLENPLEKEFESWSRGALIQEIVRLRKEIDNRERYAAMM